MSYVKLLKEMNPREYFEPPSTVSGLIFTFVKDLCDCFTTDGYRFNPIVFHEPQGDNRTVEVGFAGAVCAMSLGVKKHEKPSLDDFPIKTRNKLLALGKIRKGRFKEAYELITLKPKKIDFKEAYELYLKHQGCLSLNPIYCLDPWRKIARILKEKGC